MKKWLTYVSIACVFLLGITLAAGWLLTTPGGARWLLRATSYWASAEIDAETITGRFLDELCLDGVKVRWPTGRIEIDRFRIRWHPANLLSGRIKLSVIEIGRMAIQDDRPATTTPPDLRFPSVRLMPAFLQVEAGSFRLKELIYRRSDGDPVTADGISAQVVLSESRIKLRGLAFKTSHGSVEGGGEIQVLRPALDFDLTFIPQRPVMGLKRFSIDLKLLPTDGPEQMSGTAALSGDLASGQKLQMKGEVGLTANQIRMRRVLLSASGRPGEVSLDGRVSFVPNEPLISVSLSMRDIDLSKDLVVRTTLSGTMSIEGNPSDFRGRFTVENSDGSWRAARISGSFRGDPQGIQVSGLDGSLLNGTLKGQSQISWSKGLSVTGNLQGRNLDPSRITPDWPGRINLNIDGRLYWPEAMPLEGKLDAFLLDSHLRGKALTGRIDTRVEGGSLRLKKADLHGKGFDLSAQGELKSRLRFEAKVGDLAGLVPGASGSFNGEGWVRWREDLLTGFLTGHGKNVSIRQFRSARLDLTARLDEETNGAMDLRTKADQVVAGTIQADSVSFETKGSSDSHTIKIAVRWPEGDANGEFTGAYAKGTWRGAMTALSGNYPRGRPWAAVAPVGLSVSADRLSLAPFALVTDTGERVQLRAELALKPLSGILEAEWKRLDLTRVRRWMAKPLLTGQTNGRVKAEWLGDKQVRLHGEVDVAGTVHDPSIKLEEVRAAANFSWDKNGLDASYLAEMKDGGKLQGQLSSLDPGRLGLPEGGKMKVSWEAVDLDLIKSWLPEELTLAGRTSGRLSGQWSKGQPWVTEGEVRVLQGMIRCRTRERPIEAFLRNADFNWSWHSGSLKGNLTISLSDYGEVIGKFQLPVAGQWPPAVQKSGAVSISLQAKIEETGLLPIFFPRVIKESRGSVDLNFNANGTWDNPQLKGNVRLKKAAIQVLADSSRGKEGKQLVQFEVPVGSVKLDWGGEGLQASCDLEFTGGGKLQGRLASRQPSRLAFPEDGTLAVALQGIKLGIIRPWIPLSIDFNNDVSGRMEGGWFAGSRWRMKGDLKVSDGNLNWKSENGQLSARLKAADLHFDWEDETLAGDLSMGLERYGQAKGNFRLPFPARFPFVASVNGPIYFLLQGQFKEMGLLASLFPGVIQESRGEFDLNFTMNGTWKEPRPGGTVRLSKAGATIPSAGIRLEDVGLEARFSGDQIRVTSIHARSGPGQIGGEATFSLKDWKLSRFQGVLRGDRFQAIYLPELQVFCTPRLEFDGNQEGLKVRGDIEVPEFSVLGLQTKGSIRRSPDVVVMDKIEVPKSSTPLPLNAEVRILLGDKVVVRTGGIDCRLAGGLTLRVEPSKPMRADGEIQVVQGHYSFYGQKLTIARGRLVFSGPIDNPSLDVLALRKVKGSTRWQEQLEEVQAGVVVTGRIQSPMVRLYSQPVLPEKDVLSYIVFGQPLSKGNQSQTASLIQAAGTLLSAGESVLLKSQLSEQLGIDSLDIRATTVGSSGGKNTSGNGGSGELSRSIVTVGKYLDPRLYVGVGGSPFTKAYQVILRYSLTKHFEIETKAGTESGANLYYRIDFD